MGQQLAIESLCLHQDTQVGNFQDPSPFPLSVDEKYHLQFGRCFESPDSLKLPYQAMPFANQFVIKTRSTWKDVHP